MRRLRGPGHITGAGARAERHARTHASRAACGLAGRGRRAGAGADRGRRCAGRQAGSGRCASSPAHRRDLFARPRPRPAPAANDDVITAPRPARLRPRPPRRTPPSENCHALDTAASAPTARNCRSQTKLLVL
ncbi:hypothetical protein EVAR_8956_1 [Eumeta japonica]|uniref:Uncharacterized protein n=1 Tax=Eumeta variegata TaxID=151549 RepID=A0A4C1U162_EUMVA|nr:hypothetical protein EVAR_8956_1 [Eumeta japonica]